jgi:nucleotide-binding universal stress UspA family protein
VKILVTLDGSRESEAILPAISSLAKASSASVTLLTIHQHAEGRYPRPADPVYPVETGGQIEVESRESPLPSAPEPYESEDRADQRLRGELTDYLESLAEGLRSHGLSVETLVDFGHEPAKGIIGAASRGGFDLIAMSTHGRSGLSALIQGSVSSEVVRSGVAPVILVRPREAS